MQRLTAFASTTPRPIAAIQDHQQALGVVNRPSDSIFSLANITSEETQYHNIVCQLPTDVLLNCRDMVIQGYQPGALNKLKQALVLRFSMATQAEINEMLNTFSSQETPSDVEVSPANVAVAVVPSVSPSSLAIEVISTPASSKSLSEDNSEVDVMSLQEIEPEPSSATVKTTLNYVRALGPASPLPRKCGVPASKLSKGGGVVV